MRVTEAMIAFDRGGPILVGPWPDRSGWSRHLPLTFGACMLDRHDMPPWRRVAMLFIAFQTIVVNYGVPVADAHREFLKIDEYRWHIASDCRGAEDVPASWAKTLRR